MHATERASGARDAAGTGGTGGTETRTAQLPVTPSLATASPAPATPVVEPPSAAPRSASGAVAGPTVARTAAAGAALAGLLCLALTPALGPRAALAAVALVVAGWGLRRRLRVAHLAATLAGAGGTAVLVAAGHPVPAAVVAVLTVALAASWRAFPALPRPRALPHPSSPSSAELRACPDSLAYFATRDDRTLLRAGAGAVSARPVGSVLLAAGDPLGDPSAWPDAVRALRAEAVRQGRVPAVVGAGARAAATYRAAGFRPLYFGCEAVLDLETFSTEGRALRIARQSWRRAGRAGYTAQVCRVGDLSPAERAELAAVSADWRGEAAERGFSMALSRLFDPRDPDCLVVLGRAADGRVHGFLHLVPWGADGMSLDVMRRLREAPAILNDFLVVEAATRLAASGLRRLSLNFAVQRRALAGRARGPWGRLWRGVVLAASRWAQIQSLYRFNRKFDPRWTPRYILIESRMDLVRAGLAMARVEGFLVAPRVRHLRAGWRKARAFLAEATRRHLDPVRSRLAGSDHRGAARLLPVSSVVMATTTVGGLLGVLPWTESAVRWATQYRGDDLLRGTWWRLFTSPFGAYHLVHVAWAAFTVVFVVAVLEALVGPGRTLLVLLLGHFVPTALAFAVAWSLGLGDWLARADYGSSAAVAGACGALAVALRRRGFAVVIGLVLVGDLVYSDALTASQHWAAVGLGAAVAWAWGRNRSAENTAESPGENPAGSDAGNTAPAAEPALPASALPASAAPRASSPERGTVAAPRESEHLVSVGAAEVGSGRPGPGRDGGADTVPAAATPTPVPGRRRR
ncbi:Lysylphosphatidylglycerol synthetase, C-terminal domain, DUF2156 family [Streptoalloteichus tenebrarius]|uniref:Lysylphosphatidylglycerol synthetase, C-terminal domain, DUF2156 family n=1 Tax=Streptoalloteichus tenebrarius (strain ATCC 17920 / DSM 40477 / JCM 4838 / CBS 697.72 / NBRC 16177 / NCIMB 11028 / NRRL B-12390 / A12253. 1 / ISP 5477) TaxID=1933 RepID=A0ABT1I316_STRSD|nr:phosphatidylglycerol lysyltransferase domain-containing protein [Streptoalloteichus tenebrarius]MCP2262177.1 Lysylphosphatidylglycerol synthetase, C-terminal domain, DUF2156 family [Streptoalloteichus tenebrarius]BFF00020.1 hypothetical protein GCM10020241_16950 [Streptoalloteichus tenebrarius]